YQHVSLRFIAGITKDALENHRYIAHQIYRIIVNHHLPRHIKRLFSTRFLFNRWRTDSGRRCILCMHESGHKRGRHFYRKWLRAHRKMLTYAAFSFDTDENFAAVKRYDVGRTAFAEEPEMQLRDTSIGNEPDGNSIQLAEVSWFASFQLQTTV